MSGTQGQGPLSTGQLKLYCLAVLFFSANAILTVILPLQGDAMGMRQGEIGLMMGGYMFTCMLLRPWAGQMIVKHGASKLMRWLVLIHAGCLIAYMFAETGSLLPLLALRALQGGITAFFSMIMQLALVERLAAEDRAQGMSLYTLSTMLPQLVTPIVAFAVWRSGDWLHFILIMAALAAATLVAGYAAPLPKKPLQGDTLSLLEMFRSFSQLWQDRNLLVCSVIMLVVACVYGTVLTFIPLYTEKTGVGDASLYLLLQGLAVVFCRFVLRKRLPSDGRWHPRFISALLLSAAIGSLLLAWLEAAEWFLYAAALCNGLAIALIYPTLATYLTFVLPSNRRALLLGLFISSYDIGFSVGGLFMGVMAEYVAYSGMFIWCAVSCLIAVAVLFRYRNEMTKVVQ
jgi:MFS family permease